MRSATSFRRGTVKTVVVVAISTLSMGLQAAPGVANERPKELSGPMQHEKPIDEAKLKPCKGGPNSDPQSVPTAPPTDENVPRCKAKPTKVTAHPGGKKKIAGEDLPVPSTDGYHFQGVTTNTSTGQVGVYGRLQTVNPTVRPFNPQQEFVASWYMAYNGNPANQQWTQVGWSENSWTGDMRHVFVYASDNNVWQFFDQYPLPDYSLVPYSITSSGTSWYSWIWWNNTWNLLDTAVIPLSGAAYMQEYVEVFSAPGAHPFVPQHQNTDSQISQNGTWRLWDTSISSYTQAAAPYCLNVYAPYYGWEVRSC